ncbi:MAG: RDD family protein [Acidobacteria bacterium]|nr:MAG: RDD family protein [Acidobacteriota bacterium]
MKCPKCDYIGFEQSERCRNCGYDFSLSNQQLTADLSLRGDETAAPLGDFDLGDGRQRPARRAPGSLGDHDPERDFDPGLDKAPSSPDLPLFGDSLAESIPLVTASHPTPPLSVRRSAPSVARVRGRATPRSVEPQPDLVFGSTDENDRNEAPVVQRPGEMRAAPTATRAAAGVLDFLLLAAIDLVVVYFTLRVCRLAPSDFARLPIAPMAAFLLLLNGGYLAMLTAAGGQTIGKMAFGLRVVGPEEETPTTGRAVLRTLALLLSAIPAGLGLASILVDRDRRGLHDHLADTRVVDTPAS